MRIGFQVILYILDTLLCFPAMKCKLYFLLNVVLCDDVEQDKIPLVTFTLGAPYLIILMSVYLYLKFGPSSLIGIVVMILFLPIQVRRAASRNRLT